jgi:hypothetical protein
VGSWNARGSKVLSRELQEMILISHRGNVIGPGLLDNSPEYVDQAIKAGYQVEVDVRRVGGTLYLGHDGPQYSIIQNWLYDRSESLWIHCKNIEALIWFQLDGKLNYFWHESDTATLTSRGHIWAYPGKQPICNSVAVLPEIYNDDVSMCCGVCSDYIERYNRGVICQQ